MESIKEKVAEVIEFGEAQYGKVMKKIEYGEKRLNQIMPDFEDNTPDVLKRKLSIRVPEFRMTKA